MNAARARSGLTKLEAAGIICAIIFGLIGAISGIGSLIVSSRNQDRQEALAEQQERDEEAERAAGVVVVQAEGHVSVANYTAYPASEVVIDGSGDSGTAVYLGSLPPCHEFRVESDLEQMVIGGDKGPLPTVSFLDAYGQGWQRTYFDGLERIKRSPGFPGSDSSVDLAPHAISGCA